MIFKVNDKVKSVASCDDKRWRAIVVEVGVRQVKVRRVSDKKGKDTFWIYTDRLEVV